MSVGCRSMKKFLYEDHIGLWEKELKDFVPNRFFDVHEHIGSEDFVAEIDEERKASALMTYTDNGMTEYLEPLKQMINAAGKIKID